MIENSLNMFLTHLVVYNFLLPLQDLKFIYGRYVDWESPIDKDM